MVEVGWKKGMVGWLDWLALSIGHSSYYNSELKGLYMETKLAGGK